LSQNISSIDTATDPAIPVTLPATAGMTSKVVKGSFWALIGQALPLPVTLFTTPFMIRFLGAEAYGVMVLINLIPIYLSFGDFGMNMGSTKFASEAYAAGEFENEARIVRTASLITFLSSLPISLVLFFFSMQISVQLNIPEYLLPTASIAFKVAGVTYFFSLLMYVVNTPQLSRMRVDLATIVNSGFKIAGVLAAVLALYLGYGLVGAVVAVSISAVLTVIAHIIVSGRLLPSLYGLSIRRESIRPMLKFGGAMVVSSIAALMLVHLDKVILARMVSIKALAYYSVAFLFSNLAQLFAIALSQALFPAFAQLLKPERIKELNSLFSRCLRANAILLFPAVIIMILIAKPFFTLWAGAEFGAESTIPFYIIMAGLSFSIVAQVPCGLVIAAGRTDLLAKLYWIELFPYVGLVILLTGLYGTAGAATAWSIRAFIDAFIFIIFAHRIIGVEIAFSEINKPMLLLAGAAGALPLISLFVFDNIYLIIGTGFIFLITYSLIVWKAFLTPEEIGWIKELLTKKLPGFKMN
jgi:O-antigen/teichoic acid export membrane protein